MATSVRNQNINLYNIYKKMKLTWTVYKVKTKLWSQKLLKMNKYLFKLCMNRKLDVYKKSNDRYYHKSDGIDHINVSSRGKTKIGRILSNLARTPFTLHNHQFQSVEGFYQSHLSYYHGMRNVISKSYGNKTRRYRKKVRIKDGDPIMIWNGGVIIYKSELWDEEIKKAIKAKIEQNPKVKHALLATGNLPLVHYHVKRRNVIINESFIPNFLMKVRKDLKTKEPEFLLRNKIGYEFTIKFWWNIISLLYRDFKISRQTGRH